MVTDLQEMIAAMSEAGAQVDLAYAARIESLHTQLDLCSTLMIRAADTMIELGLNEPVIDDLFRLAALNTTIIREEL